MNLETDRLFIRPHIASNFDDYFDYIMEPELQYMLGLNDVHDRASAQETFQWLMENSIFLALVYKETGKNGVDDSEEIADHAGQQHESHCRPCAA